MTVKTIETTVTVGNNNDVESVQLTDEDRREGKYSHAALAKILGALNQDGLVILKNVIPVDIIDKFNAKMCEDADRRISDPAQQYNHGVKSNILQRPPIADPEYLEKDVYFNSYLLQVANAYLGSKPVWNWLTANTALANTGGKRQPAHKDSSFDHPLFPYYFIANIPLCDFSVENGSTEFWLGSHAHTTQLDQQVARTPEDIKPYPTTSVGGRIPPILDEVREKRRQVRPPIQPACCRGDIMIRDLRTWHAGMPNDSDKHRVMLALGYQSPFHPNSTLRVHLPLSQRKFFLENSGDSVDVQAQWYTDEELKKTNADTIFDTRPTYSEETT